MNSREKIVHVLKDWTKKGNIFIQQNFVDLKSNSALLSIEGQNFLSDFSSKKNAMKSATKKILKNVTFLLLPCLKKNNFALTFYLQHFFLILCVKMCKAKDD